jgi:hypothetical protein
MREYTEKEIINKEIKRQETKVICNKCGTTQDLFGEDYEREWQANEFQSLSCYFGYGSRYDMESWQFDLCEDCLTELIKTFKFVPSGFGEDGYIAAYPQIMFEKWKETGIIDLEAVMTEDEIKKNGGSLYSDDED